MTELDDILKDAQTFVNAALELANLMGEIEMTVALIEVHAGIQRVRNALARRAEAGT